MSQAQSSPSPVGVQKHLKGVDYPASKEDLLAAARNNQAPEDVLEMLQNLPADTFNGPDDVMKAYGQVR